MGIEYAHAVLDADRADQLLQEVDDVLRAGLARPATRLRELPVSAPRPAPPAGRPAAGGPGGAATAARPVPDEWSDEPRPDLLADVTLDRLLADAAAAHCDTAAVACGPAAITYAELDREANQLAHLLRSLGARPEQPVVVHAPRRLDTVVAIVAVLRAGAAYVPVDPGSPRDRVERVVTESGAQIVLCHGAPAGPVATGRHYVDLDAVELASWPDTPPADAARPDDLAYVVYTSGSTGAPKGVMVEHRHIVASTLARRGFYGPGPERFLLLSPFSFDSSMAGLFWTLTSGGTIVVPEAGAHRDVMRLGDLAARHDVTHLLALPS
ncbi:MAG: AMP-binding protein, partial [Acidimicrobiia bacterium]|nr:AMP-binding protein [Acidimicrobiia bacterium]